MNTVRTRYMVNDIAAAVSFYTDGRRSRVVGIASSSTSMIFHAEMERLRAAKVHFRSDILTGPGGSEVVLDDPAGNPVELFQPADR